MPNRIANLKIDTSRPGFYDDPAFVAAEKENPELIDAYGEHIEEMQLTPGYLEYARGRVDETAAFLAERLSADPRRGACVDLSLVLGRFLEFQGVWNYAVIGAVAVSFPPRSRLPIYRMRGKHGVPGHVWLRAPPYRVVDLTIALQQYTRGEEQHLPSSVIVESPAREKSHVRDIADDAQVRAMRAALGRVPTLEDVRSLQHPTWMVRHEGTEIRYIPTGTTALTDPFENAKNVCLSGKYPPDLWREFESIAAPPKAYVP